MLAALERNFPIIDEPEFVESIPEVEDDPWTLFKERYPLGSQISGELIYIKEQEATVRLDMGIEGWLFASEMNTLGQQLFAGDLLDLRIACFDKRHKSVGGSLERLALYTQYHEFRVAHPVGTYVDAEVSSVDEDCVAVQLAAGIEGQLGRKQLLVPGRSDRATWSFSLGEQFRARIES